MPNLICHNCKNQFYRKNPDYRCIKTFCSKQCRKNCLDNITIKPCGFCSKLVTRDNAEMRKSKSGNIFCSNSCAASYNNLHKTIGNRRSKLEIYLEEQIVLKYPNLMILFNDKDIINSELDIYIPSFKLAFELNGIFHYEPIFGEEKLRQIQNNDDRKFQACIEKGIELCIIDNSIMKYFTEKQALKFLQIITSIIDQKLK